MEVDSDDEETLAAPNAIRRRITETETLAVEREQSPPRLRRERIAGTSYLFHPNEQLPIFEGVARPIVRVARRRRQQQTPVIQTPLDFEMHGCRDPRGNCNECGLDNPLWRFEPCGHALICGPCLQRLSGICRILICEACRQQVEGAVRDTVASHAGAKGETDASASDYLELAYRNAPTTAGDIAPTPSAGGTKDEEPMEVDAGEIALDTLDSALGRGSGDILSDDGFHVCVDGECECEGAPWDGHGDASPQ